MHKGFKIMLLVMFISLVVASLWNAVPAIKNSVHFVLDPTLGALFNFNANFGLIIVVIILGLALTLVQKYTTDQEALKILREEQKAAQEDMKKYKDNPDKMLDLQKKQMEFMPRTFELTMMSNLYTLVPFILLFRWFNDYFTVNGDIKLIGLFIAKNIHLFPGWLWAYLLLSIVSMAIFRKVLKVQ